MKKIVLLLASILIFNLSYSQKYDSYKVFCKTYTFYENYVDNECDINVWFDKDENLLNINSEFLNYSFIIDSEHIVKNKEFFAINSSILDSVQRYYIIYSRKEITITFIEEDGLEYIIKINR